VRACVRGVPVWVYILLYQRFTRLFRKWSVHWTTLAVARQCSY